MEKDIEFINDPKYHPGIEEKEQYAYVRAMVDKEIWLCGIKIFVLNDLCEDKLKPSEAYIANELRIENTFRDLINNDKYKFDETIGMNVVMITSKKQIENSNS